MTEDTIIDVVTEWLVDQIIGPLFRPLQHMLTSSIMKNISSVTEISMAHEMAQNVMHDIYRWVAIVAISVAAMCLVASFVLTLISTFYVCCMCSRRVDYQEDGEEKG